MRTRSHLEIEIKLPVPDSVPLKRRLAALGATRLGRVRELDTLFDTPRRHLARRGHLLRLRRRAGRGLLTYKGPAAAGMSYKVRTELELDITSPDRLQGILEALGLRAWFRYEKFRTSYRLPGLRGLAIQLDRTPIGTYLELEGPKRAIDRAAGLLGYGPEDYIKASYYSLYRQACRRRKVAPGHMLFQ